LRLSSQKKGKYSVEAGRGVGTQGFQFIGAGFFTSLMPLEISGISLKIGQKEYRRKKWLPT